MTEKTRIAFMQNKRKKRHFTLIIITALVILIGLGGYSYLNVKQAADKSYLSDGLDHAENGSKKTVLRQKKPIAILLMGTDTGALGRSYKGRTDSIMVAAINPKTKKTTLVSIERDYKVDLPGYPEDSPSKLNAAYTYGGVALLEKTLTKYFKIPINAYVLINMGGMKSVINQLNGIALKPLLSFKYAGYSYHKGVLTHMNGSKALEYCRMRYDDPEGDYGRQKRQRQVISATLQSSADVSTLLNAGFMNAISKQVRTDLTFGDLSTMAASYRQATNSVQSDYTHGTGFYEDGISYQDISLKERQRISNLLRKAMGMTPKTIQ